MEARQTLLSEPVFQLDLWRLVSQGLPLQTTVAAVARILARAAPLSQVAVLVIDAHAPRLERVMARAVDEPGLAPDHEVISGSEIEIERLRAWCRAGAEVRVPAGAPVPAPLAAWLGRHTPGMLQASPILPAEQPGAAVSALALFAITAKPGVSLDLGAEHPSMLAAVLSAALTSHVLRERVAELEATSGMNAVVPWTGTDHDGLSDRIIGADGGLRPVLERVALVCRSDVPVLILGETGAGKEIIARTLHAQSPRAGKPFIRVNCGAIPPELIDSELFGHERGSFTGAVAARRGWFEQAHEGTLFLDEIGELSLAAQVRLLRILQDGQLTRVGGETPIRVDVRFIAATHRDLSTMVQRGTFREDLWYRLAVFPINLPPLREHPEDIPAITEFFARRAAARYGLPLRLPSREDLDMLVRYAWPGNVRELGAVVTRAVLLGQGHRLEVAKALGTTGAHEPAPPAGSSRSTVEPAAVEPLDAAIRRHIEAALRATRGRIEGPQGAAALLRVNPHTLRARMRKLDLDWARFRKD